MRGAETFRRELLWRQFAHHVLHHFPATPEQPLDARFAKFFLAAVGGAVVARLATRGETGLPPVDAGLRELWTTGTLLRNPTRMIVASFLTKHLRLHWREGARADTWRYAGGCRSGQQPVELAVGGGLRRRCRALIRIFNPVLQSRKFDPAGEYLARWLPELKKLPARYRHAPWLAPAQMLTRAGIRLGVNYPYPVMDPAHGRAQELDAFQRWKRRER